MTAFIFGIALIATAAGCAENPRQAVEGRVTLDGEPLSKAEIRFEPLSGTPGPSAGGGIDRGYFSIPRDGGPFAGEFRVEIIAWRPSGKMRIDPGMYDEAVELDEQYLPPRYNAESLLTAVIKTDEVNRLEFALESKQ